MKECQLAAQLFTCRDYMKTAEEMAANLPKIKEAGYAAVQVSGVGPIPEEEIRKICEDNGLPICATHEPGNVICEETQKVIDRLGKLGCKYTAYPFPHMPVDTPEKVAEIAGLLNAAGAAMAAAGQVLMYHNHNHEFLRLGDKTVLEMIYEQTDPANVQGEIDTYWVQAGGGNPTSWCESLKGRLPVLHLKDYGIVPGNNVVITEVGNGNLDWKSIIAAGDAAGTEWFVVEQDNNWINDDPFESLAVSAKFIKENLCI